MLKTRLMTAAVLLLSLLALIFFSSSAFLAAALFVVLLGITAYEWLSLLPKTGRYAEWIKLGCFVSASFLALAFYMLSTHHWWLILFVAMFWLYLTWRMVQFEMGRTMCCQVIDYLAFMIVPMAAWLSAIALHQKSPALLLYVFILVSVADSAAYFVGRQFGKHKLAERLSPNKTWQGVIGAVVAVALLSLLVGATQLEETGRVLQFMLVSLLTAAVSIVGDLYESYIKRQAEVKDSGYLLPGHGGFWDRLDSHLAALTVFAACAYMIGLIG